jgi:hypothetical protein
MRGFRHRWPKRRRERRSPSLGSSAHSGPPSAPMTPIPSTPLSSGSPFSTCNFFSPVLQVFTHLTLNYGSFSLFQYHFRSGFVLIGVYKVLMVLNIHMMKKWVRKLTHENISFGDDICLWNHANFTPKKGLNFLPSN